MGDLAVPQGEILDFATGEVLDPRDTERVANLLERLRLVYRDDIRPAIRACEEAIIAEAERLGTKTIRAGDYEAKVSGGPELVWDTEVLELLREEGLPDERFDQLVKTTVTYRVDARVAKQLAAANPRYREIIEAAQGRAEKPHRVSVKRG